MVLYFFKRHNSEAGNLTTVTNNSVHIHCHQAAEYWFWLLGQMNLCSEALVVFSNDNVIGC